MTSDEWNKAVPVGTVVAWFSGDGQVTCVRTTGPADEIYGGLVTVMVETAQHPVLVDRLRVIRREET